MKTNCANPVARPSVTASWPGPKPAGTEKALSSSMPLCHRLLAKLEVGGERRKAPVQQHVEWMRNQASAKSDDSRISRCRASPFLSLVGVWETRKRLPRVESITTTKRTANSSTAAVSAAAMAELMPARRDWRRDQ